MHPSEAARLDVSRQGEQAASRWQHLAADLLAGRGWISLLVVLLMGVLLLVGGWVQITQPRSDAGKYACYAYAFWHGGTDFITHVADFPGCGFIQQYAASLPLHTLPREYPILALVPFSLALLASFAWYQVAFGVCMVLLAGGLYWYLGRVGPRGASLALAICLVLGGWGTAVGRFDLVPAAFTLFCLVAADRRRFHRAYLLLGIATMFKLYPLPLLLPLFLAEQRLLRGTLLHWRRLAGVGVFAATCAVCFALSLLVSVNDAFSPLGYFAGRPIQIESLSASIMWGLSLLGATICTDFTFGSLNVYDRVQGVCTNAGQSPGLLTQTLSLLFLALLVVGVIWVAWMQWRGGLLLGQTFLALLLVIMLTGKVFSPQYLLWLAPLVAYVQGFDLAWLVLWGGVSLLTTVIYPYLYSATARIPDLPSVAAFYPTIALRNSLFAVVALGYLFDVRRLRTRPLEQARPSPRARETQAATPSPPAR